MATTLIPLSLVFGPDRSVIAPLTITGLPAEVEALGTRWQRKSEFHLTAIGTRKLEPLEADRPDLWATVERLAYGRSVGPVTITDDVRRCSHPERPELRTLIVMARCPGVDSLYRELSTELAVQLSPSPAHVTLYSTDPDQGIGIVDEAELLERAPPEHQETLRRAIRFDRVFAP